MARENDLPYTSPPRKLLRFFLKSRDQWKAKCQRAKATVKRLENRVRFLEKSKAEWKSRARALEKENAHLKAQAPPGAIQGEAFPPLKKNADTPVLSLAPGFSVYPRHHTYSLGLITLSLLLQVSACVGLRGVEKVGQVLTRFFPFTASIPSWSSHRLWLLRVGYYKLTRPKERADDWVWIVDLTIQAGSMKCLTVLGRRRSAWEDTRKNKTLSQADMEPITLVPVEQSNGEIVYQPLEEARQKTGVPRQIIADKGSDVKAGIEKFIQQHPETDYIYDVKHFTACLLEGEFKSDPMWVEFTQWASQTRSAVHQTPFFYLEPPNQRSKSRYMNMDILVDWGVNILAFLDHLQERCPDPSEREIIQEKMDWILPFRAELAEWKTILELVGKTEIYVRTQGLSQGGDQALRSLLRLAPPSTERTIRMRWSLIEYVLDESLKAQPGECLLGSSEVIESVFGKFKYMQREHEKGCLTAMVLAIPAMVSQTTQEVVQSALEAVPVQKVRTWMKETFGKSPRTKRKEAFSIPANTEQKPDQLRLSA